MINNIEMINWRAYEHQEVPFGPGITFLMGPNGTGKTSILEAIGYALTGETSTVRERGKLLRDPNQIATVRLTFTVDGQVYVVERSQSYRRAKNATLIRTGDKKRMATSHRKVTAQIERLMSVSADFLQRIVYMAEGDVFRFLNQPPGKALDLQIRQVLGLTQLDEFVQVVETAEREVKAQISAVRGLLGQLERLGVTQGSELEQRLRDIDTRRELLLADLRSVQEEIDLHRHENENLLRLVPLLDQALPALQQNPDTWRMAQQKPVLTLFTQLERKITEIDSTIQQYQIQLARLEGEQSAYQRILDILLPYAERAETLPCPVCDKPMTRGERERVMQDVQDNIRRITGEARQLDGHLNEASQMRDGPRRQTEGLRELRNALAHVKFQSLSPQATVADLQEIIQSRQELFQAHLDDLQQQAAEMEREISQLEEEKAEYLAVRRGMQSLGYASPDETRQALVNLEIRYLSLRAASRAAQETLTVQRNTNVEAIYDQVARVWQAFLGRGDWRVQLDSGGMPILEDYEGHRFDLSQFSGGEKTALLVVLHTIISHHFANSDFLLIDEPLEHLDPVNRRSLVRFLVSAYHRNSFRQAIVATFEESLIRKYMSDEGVNVIHLQS